MRVPQIVTYAVREKEWSTKVSFGRTVMQALELLWLAKRQGCSYKFHSKFWNGLGMILRYFELDNA